MRRTTIFVDDPLLRAVKRYAQRQGKSFAQVVREALLAYTRGSDTAEPRLPSFTGRFASGQADTAERADELLWRDPHR